MRGRLVRTARKRLLAAFSDEAILRDAARRINRDAGTDLLSSLAEHLRLKVAGELGQRILPVREVDYPEHQIKIVLSSPTAATRVRAAEKEPVTVEWIERLVRPGDTFYDIGANVGAYSLIAAKATDQGARVFAVEPSPATFRDLAENVLLNGCGDSVVPIPIALWSDSGLISFTYRSLAAGAARHRLTAEPTAGQPLTQRVLGIRLDDLVEHFGLPVPTHAKIDVDGYELDVLQGAERTLERREWQSIIIELDREDTERNGAVVSLLTDIGFGPGRRHERMPSRRYPDPDARPDVYWTFSRAAA